MPNIEVSVIFQGFGKFSLEVSTVGMRATGQVRIMGGAIVLSIATSVFNSYTRLHLQKLTGKPDFELNQHSTQDSMVNEEVRHVFTEAYSLEMAILAAFSGA